MAQERDPKKLEEWEKQQKEWLEIVAKEDQERRSQGSASDGKRSKKDASDGTHCRPDPGYRARSLSVGRRLAKDGQPRGTPFLPAEEGTIIAEGDDEKGDDTLPEKGKHKKRKKSKKPDRVKKEEDKPEDGSDPKDPKDPKGGGGGNGDGGNGDGGGVAAAVAAT